MAVSKVDRMHTHAHTHTRVCTHPALCNRVIIAKQQKPQCQLGKGNGLMGGGKEGGGFRLLKAEMYVRTHDIVPVASSHK